MAAQLDAKDAKPPYAFKRVDAYDGGIGAFATRDLKRGEVILHEPPLRPRPTMATLEQRVAALDEKTRKRLFSLCDWRAKDKQPKTALGVFQANGYPRPTARTGRGRRLPQI